MINDIIFKGKRGIDWKDVEKYLKQYVGEFYIMADSSDIIYIGTDLPDEFTGSIYTRSLRGAAAKAKANAAQALPELVEIATDSRRAVRMGRAQRPACRCTRASCRG